MLEESIMKLNPIEVRRHRAGRFGFKALNSRRYAELAGIDLFDRFENYAIYINNASNDSVIITRYHHFDIPGVDNDEI